MSDPKRLFFSYSTPDRRYVAALAEKLRAIGHEVWMDVAGIPAGEQFPDEIADAIRQCDVVLVALSKHAADSPWVRRELEFALALGKPIVPVQKRQVVMPDWYELQLGTRQRVTIPDPGHPMAGTALERALQGQGGSTVPRRLWPIALGAAVVAAVAFVVISNVSGGSDSKWTMQNIEFVLDRSGAAAETMEVGASVQTKAAAAVAALQEKVGLNQGNSMALRQYGQATGGCGPSELVVDFNSDNGTNIIGASDPAILGGPSNLYDAVIAALQDFTDFDPDLALAGATRKVIVFAAGSNACGSSVERLRQEIEEASGVRFELRLVGLNLSDEQSAEIATTFSDVCDVNCNVQYVNAATVADIEGALDDWVVVEPVLDDFQAIATFNGEIIDNQNLATNAGNNLDPAGFRAGLAAAAQSLERTQPAFDDVIARLSTDDRFTGVIAAAQLLRERQRTLLAGMAAIESVIETRAEDPDGEDAIRLWNEAVDAVNVLVDEENRAFQDLIDRQEQLRATLEAG